MTKSVFFLLSIWGLLAYCLVSTLLLLIFIVSMQHVRRAAVLALSTFAHNKPNLIKGLLPDLLPLLYDQTIVKVTCNIAFCFCGVLLITCHDNINVTFSFL